MLLLRFAVRYYLSYCPFASGVVAVVVALAAIVVVPAAVAFFAATIMHYDTT